MIVSALCHKIINIIKRTNIMFDLCDSCYYILLVIKSYPGDLVVGSFLFGF